MVSTCENSTCRLSVCPRTNEIRSWTCTVLSWLKVIARSIPQLLGIPNYETSGNLSISAVGVISRVNELVEVAQRIALETFIAVNTPSK